MNTKKHIKAELAEIFDDNVTAFFYGDIDVYLIESLKKIGCTVEEVQQRGGEGEGDDYWRVYKIETQDKDLYVKFDGRYTSYDGAEYTSWFFVVPKEVVVIQYEAV